MEKSLTCPCCCYTLALLLSPRCFLIFPVLCVLQLYLWTCTSNSRNPYCVESQRKNNILNGILLLSLFNSPFFFTLLYSPEILQNSIHIQQGYTATNVCPTKEAANHTTKYKLKKNKTNKQKAHQKKPKKTHKQGNLRIHFRDMTAHKTRAFQRKLLLQSLASLQARKLFTQRTLFQCINPT